MMHKPRFMLLKTVQYPYIIMPRIVVLKIGGSVITKKDENLLEAKTDVIRGVARAIKKAMEEREFKLVLVHGAGPFGHKLVQGYGINDGLKTKKDVEGFVKTCSAISDLNKIVVGCFLSEGLLAIGLQPTGFVVQKNKKIEKFGCEIIEALLGLEENIIPVLCGDMVIDKKLKASVLSGDAIVPYLASKIGASQVLMGTDVDGIFTADPKKDAEANFIKDVNLGNLAEVLNNSEGASTVDVTGGMKGKVMEIKENLSGIETIVFNLNIEGNLYKILTGKEAKKTTINL